MTNKPNSPLPYRLMTPGPVPLTKGVRSALALPMIHHRTREFTEILKSTLSRLKVAFQTQQPVIIHSSTGSGAMESALVNTLSPGDEVLFVIAGKFGERWEKMGQAHGIKTHCLTLPLAASLSLSELKAKLQERSYKAVCTQACESSTGSEHPIEGMVKMVKQLQPECLFLVDAISGLMTMPINMDAWGIDVLVAGGQKGFGLPTGLAFIALSKSAWKANQTASCPRFYFDLAKEKKASEKGQTNFSSPVSHIRALHSLLATFDQSTLNATIAKAQLQAHATRQAGLGLGLKIFSASPSSAVTTLLLPETLDGNLIKEYLEDEYNITVAGGQDELKGKIIRIGHLGPISNEDLIFTISALGSSLFHFKMNSLDDTKIKSVVQQLEQDLG